MPPQHPPRSRANRVTGTKVDWPSATSNLPNATHVIDFGPGGPGGAGALVNKIGEGPGAAVPSAPSLMGCTRDFGYKFELFDRESGNGIPETSPGGPLRFLLVKDWHGLTLVDS